MSPTVRLPLVDVTDPTKAELAAVLADLRSRYPDYVVTPDRVA